MARSTSSKTQSKLMDTWGPLSKTKPKPLRSTPSSSRRRGNDDDELDLEDVEDEERSVVSDGEEQPRLESGTVRLSPRPRRPPPSADDDSDQDDLSSPPPSSSSPRKKLIRRSQRILTNPKYDDEDIDEVVVSSGDDECPVKANTQARKEWEGEGNVGREGEISMLLRSSEDEEAPGDDEEDQGGEDEDDFIVEDDEVEVSTTKNQLSSTRRTSQPVASSSRLPPSSSIKPKPSTSSTKPSRVERTPSPPSSTDDPLRLSSNDAPLESPAPKRPHSYSRKKRKSTSISPKKPPTRTTLPSFESASPPPPPRRPASSSLKLEAKPTPSILKRPPPPPATSSGSDSDLPDINEAIRSATADPPPATSSGSDSDLPDINEAIRSATADKSAATAKTKGKGRGRAVDVEEFPPPPPRSRPRMRMREMKTKVPLPISDEDEDDSDELIIEPPKGRTLRRKGAVVHESEPEEDDQEEHDDDEVASPSSRRGEPTPVKRKRKPKVVVFSEDEDEDEDEESESGDESSDAPRPSKKRISRRQRSDSDEEEDLDDADGNAVVQTGSRLRSNPTQSSGSKAKQTALQKLRQLRSRKSGSSPTIHVIDDTEDESENEVVEEDPWEEGEDVDAEEGGDASDHSSRDSFIASDDDEAVELPAEFQTVQPREQQFSIVVSYHIYLLANGPSWIRSTNKTEYFSLPLDRIRRHIRDLMNQKVASSVWPTHLKKSLELYPHWDSEHMEDLPPCDACRITNRVATRFVTLGGQPYDPDTFETLVDDDSDDDYRNKKRDKGEDRTFNCGKYCAAKAHLYHRMAHWEYDLHEFVKHHIDRLEDESEDEEVDDPVDASRRFVPFEALADPHRPSKSNGNGIVEWFDKKGFMAEEYRKYLDLEDAQADMYKKGEEDD